MKKSQLKRLIKECIKESMIVTDNGLDIDIHRHTGLLLIGKYDMGIELVKEDVEEIIKFYNENKDRIASKDDFK